VSPVFGLVGQALGQPHSAVAGRGRRLALGPKLIDLFFLSPEKAGSRVAPSSSIPN
jgi:hypothetical protein